MGASPKFNTVLLEGGGPGGGFGSSGGGPGGPGSDSGVPEVLLEVLEVLLGHKPIIFLNHWFLKQRLGTV